MPIITLYGCKGGTGRTTAAAALTLGLIAESYDVLVADTNAEDRWFEQWADHMAGSVGPSWTGKVTSTANALELMALKQDLGDDLTKYLVIDTSRYPSDLRLMALDVADVVVMPFGSFLDASIGIRNAAAEIPKNKQLIGLPFGFGSEISDLVAHWMPVLSNALPQDERLRLFSKQADTFAKKALKTKAPAIDGLEGQLRFLTREVSGLVTMRAMRPTAKQPASALTTINASLAGTVRGTAA